MKKINKLLIKIVTIIMFFYLIILINLPKVFADVGDFETYDYGYSSSSSWDSGWDSDWDSDWNDDWGSSWDTDYSSGSYASSFEGDFFNVLLGMLFFNKGGTLFTLVVIFLIAILPKQRSRRNRVDWYKNSKSQQIYQDRLRRMENNSYRNYNNVDNGYFTTKNNQ